MKKENLMAANNELSKDYEMFSLDGEKSFSIDIRIMKPSRKKNIHPTSEKKKKYENYDPF